MHQFQTSRMDKVWLSWSRRSRNQVWPLPPKTGVSLTGMAWSSTSPRTTLFHFVPESLWRCPINLIKLLHTHPNMMVARAHKGLWWTFMNAEIQQEHHQCTLKWTCLLPIPKGAHWLWNLQWQGLFIRFWSVLQLANFKMLWKGCRTTCSSLDQVVSILPLPWADLLWWRSPVCLQGILGLLQEEQHWVQQVLT